MVWRARGGVAPGACPACSSPAAACGARGAGHLSNRRLAVSDAIVSMANAQGKRARCALAHHLWPLRHSGACVGWAGRRCRGRGGAEQHAYGAGTGRRRVAAHVAACSAASEEEEAASAAAGAAGLHARQSAGHSVWVGAAAGPARWDPACRVFAWFRGVAASWAAQSLRSAASCNLSAARRRRASDGEGAPRVNPWTGGSRPGRGATEPGARATRRR